MAARLKVLAGEGNNQLIFWGNDDGLEGTRFAKIAAIVKKYHVTLPYVSVESTMDGEFMNWLLTNYGGDIVSAVYDRSGGQRTRTKKQGSPAPQVDDLNNLSAFVVVNANLVAVCLGETDSQKGEGSKIYTFFADPSVFKGLEVSEFRPHYPIGNYSLESGMTGDFLAPLDIKDTEKPILDEFVQNQLETDTNAFFANAEFYAKNKMPHKRGILLLGPAGTGKTSQIKYYLSHLTDKFGVIIDTARYIGNSTYQFLGAALGSADKVLVFEDVDGVTRDFSSRSAFLNFLDGVTELEHCLVVATTNYPGRLDSAILDRPSRFDTILYIAKPSADMRKMFLLKWFPELIKDEARLTALAAATDGYSGAFFKELFIMTGLRKCSIEEAAKHIEDRKALIKLAKSGELEEMGGRMPDDMLQKEGEEMVVEYDTNQPAQVEALRASLRMGHLVMGAQRTTTIDDVRAAMAAVDEQVSDDNVTAVYTALRDLAPEFLEEEEESASQKALVDGVPKDTSYGDSYHDAERYAEATAKWLAGVQEFLDNYDIGADVRKRDADQAAWDSTAGNSGFLKAGLDLTTVVKEARQWVEEHLKAEYDLSDPETAQWFGDIQEALSASRSVEELSTKWDALNDDSSLKPLESFGGQPSGEKVE
jgi:chromosomal replication initiation ATPase DnaA